MRHELIDLHARIETTHRWFTGRREIFITVIERLIPDPVKSRWVLNVGCGTGVDVAAIRASGYPCLGIDSDPPDPVAARE